MVKEAARYAEEIGLQLQLEYPNLNCIQHKSGRGNTSREAESAAEEVPGVEVT